MSSERTIAGVSASSPVSEVCVLNSLSVLLVCSPLLLFMLAVAVRPSSSPLGELSCPDDLAVRLNSGCWLRMEHIRTAETYVLAFLTRSSRAIVNEGGKAQTE